MNSPEAIWNWLLLPALCGLAAYGVALAVGAWCAANVAKHLTAALDVEKAQDRELPQSVLDDLSNPCLDPNIHSAQGCQPCTDDLAVIAALAVIAEHLPAYKRNPR